MPVLSGIFREWEESQRMLDRLVLERPAENEEAEAYDRFGKKSDFDLVFSGGDRFVAEQPSINVIWPKDPECDEDSILAGTLLADECDEEKPKVLEYTEVNRVSEDVRVENPDDSDQYVIVQRVKEMLLRGPKNTYHKLIFNPPSG